MSTINYFQDDTAQILHVNIGMEIVSISSEKNLIILKIRPGLTRDCHGIVQSILTLRPLIIEGKKSGCQTFLHTAGSFPNFLSIIFVFIFSQSINELVSKSQQSVRVTHTGFAKYRATLDLRCLCSLKVGRFKESGSGHF